MIASTAARAAPVWAIAGMPWCGETVTLTIVPAPASRIASSYAASHIASVPLTFSRWTACQPLVARPSAGTMYWPPALLSTRSSRPRRSSVSATIRSAPARSRMSAATHEQRSPISAAASSRTSARRPAITTEAPHRTSSAAAALPRLVPPPVTIATRPPSAPSTNTREASTSIPRAP